MVTSATFKTTTMVVATATSIAADTPRRPIRRDGTSANTKNTTAISRDTGDTVVKPNSSSVTGRFHSNDDTHATTSTVSTGPIVSRVRGTFGITSRPRPATGGRCRPRRTTRALPTRSQ
jgi:hypothetical protein